MNKVLSKIYFVIFFTLPSLLFGAKDGGNITSKLSSSINKEIIEVGSSIASIINTISIVFGVIWIVVLLLMVFFNIEAIKTYAKYLIGSLVIIAVVFGITLNL